MENEKPDLKAAAIEDTSDMVDDVDRSCDPLDTVAVESSTEPAVEFYMVIGMTRWKTYDNLAGLDENALDAHHLPGGGGGVCEGFVHPEEGDREDPTWGGNDEPPDGGGEVRGGVNLALYDNQPASGGGHALCDAHPGGGGEVHGGGGPALCDAHPAVGEGVVVPAG